MLKQNQALEPVKLSSHSLNMRSSLAGGFIKSKLYFLMLLTMTTGGIITIPALVSPAQAGLGGILRQAFDNGVVTTARIIPNLPTNQRVIRIRAGEWVQWVCERGGYGTVTSHTIEFSGTRYSADYNNPLLLQFNSPGTYRYLIDGAEYVISVE